MNRISVVELCDVAAICIEILKMCLHTQVHPHMYTFTTVYYTSM
jgi:hypothetical protein